ncbi:dihydrolipoyl dehydrogenase family protein [Helicovermis profundi]|uniref:FAD-dependent oxidoreductase n=1 Tax=Helicovermis profundi TaxID=3065157 RepID=A0AAU9E1P7_9FIRM|nr:FAD-dependent oxidoreductase [Clostridia bacterium S502]
MKVYDIIVIGMGPAGMAVSGMASNMGLKVLGIDGEKLGGECLNTGCIPSKSLLKSAYFKDSAEHLNKFGLNLKGDIEVVNPLEIVRNQLKMLTGEGLHNKFSKVDMILKKGYAKFINSNTIKVNDVEYSARTIFIATGTKPMIVPIPGLSEIDVLTNENMFNLDKIPNSLTIIGGGAIGTEMAQAFSRLGSDVTIVQMDDHLIPNGDEEAGKLLEKVFNKEGIKVFNSTTINKVEMQDAKIVTFTSKGNFISDEILVATGRKPVIDRLDLDSAGIKYDKKGIKVDEFNRTNIKSIYAVGDCNGVNLLSHSAMHQGMTSLMHMLKGNDDNSLKRSNFPVPWSVFTSPEVAQVGLSEKMAINKEIDFFIVKEEYKTYARAITDGKPEGFVKIITDKKGKIYGATIIGEAASELIQEWTMAIQNNLTMFNIMMMQHSFPTISILNKSVAEKWMMMLVKNGEMEF